MKIFTIIISALFISVLQAEGAEMLATKPTFTEINIDTVINQKYPSCKMLSSSDLNKDLQQYLQNTFGDHTPGIVSADLTGDGIPDYAILLRCKKNEAPNRATEKFVILVGKKNNKYNWNFIAEWDDKLSLDNLYLSLIKPTSLKDLDNGKTVQLKNAGIELNLFEAAARVYYVENGIIKYIQVSD